MKPTTPQEFANCYGTFIADLVIVAGVFPAFYWTWLQTSLPDVLSAYKLNASVFSAFSATITSFPSTPKGGPRYYNTKQAGQYNDAVNKVWTAIGIDLKNALTCADVDPTLANKILASFKKSKPKEIKGFDGKS